MGLIDLNVPGVVAYPQSASAITWLIAHGEELRVAFKENHRRPGDLVHSLAVLVPPMTTEADFIPGLIQITCTSLSPFMTSPLTLRRLWRIFGVRLHRSERLWPTSKSSPIPSEGATIRGNRFAFRSEYLFWDYDRSGLCVSGSVRSSTGLEIG